MNIETEYNNGDKVNFVDRGKCLIGIINIIETETIGSKTNIYYTIDVKVPSEENYTDIISHEYIIEEDIINKIK